MRISAKARGNRHDNRGRVEQLHPDLLVKVAGPEVLAPSLRLSQLPEARAFALEHLTHVAAALLPRRQSTAGGLALSNTNRWLRSTDSNPQPCG